MRPWVFAAALCVSLLGCDDNTDATSSSENAVPATTPKIASATEPTTSESVTVRKEKFSPYAEDDFPRRVFWGDTHVHSHLSMDANIFGNKSLSPSDAFRFARGEAVTASNGMTAKLRRPLDFLVVADHAEYLGVLEGLGRADEVLLQDTTALRWQEQLAKGDPTPMIEFAQSLASGDKLLDSPPFERSVWKRVVEGADAQNRPGVFTAFIGYEWTSMPAANNLHRVVIFRDGADRTSQVLPFSAFDSDKPEDLWAYLAQYEAQTGGQAFAIPHNSNISGGLMFKDAMSDSTPIDRAYAEQRAQWEPLVEATQVKGDSEAHPFLSPNDEFADYESWDKSNVGFSVPHQNAWFAGEYVRAALNTGLDVERRKGANPFRFGLIGSTDSHTALATADENDYWGKFVAAHPSPGRWKIPLVPSDDLPFLSYEWQMAASGYAAVWATENTREALFDAMRRRETYATTGPRMAVRLFGGWAFEEIDAVAPDLAKTGYEKGVPMGGILSARPAEGAPTFLVSALKDPDGANLDRVQIIKGWRDADGKPKEQIYNVALSGGRAVAEDGSVPPVGNTVDVETATYTNTIGAVALATWWRDPDFDPNDRAFYYARVLEIPTPRWTTYDAAIYGLDLPDDIPRTTQERAYTSAIWYTPQR